MFGLGLSVTIWNIRNYPTPLIVSRPTNQTANSFVFLSIGLVMSLIAIPGTCAHRLVASNQSIKPINSMKHSDWLCNSSVVFGRACAAVCRRHCVWPVGRIWRVEIVDQRLKDLK